MCKYFEFYTLDGKATNKDEAVLSNDNKAWNYEERNYTPSV